MAQSHTDQIAFLQLRGTVEKRAKSTDRDKLTANKLTAKRRFRYSDFVTDFGAVIS